MFKSIYLFFIFICLRAFSTNAGPVLGLEEVMNDTSSISIETSLSHVLAVHPLLKEVMPHEMQTAKPRLASNRTGPFLLALLLLFVFSLARLVFPRYFVNLFQIFTGLSNSKRHIRDQLENDNRASLWFYTIFYISLGFLVYQFYMRNSIHPFSGVWYVNYIVCSLGVFMLLNLRSGLIRLIGWVFKRSDYVQLFLFNKKLVNEFLGLILFPVCILILISSGKVKFALMVIAALLCVTLFLYSYVRNLSVIRNLFRISFVHFLLYICALELIPVLILIKIIR